MKTFEYRRVKNLDEREMNALGAEGWELISVYMGQNTWLYFKRERSDGDQRGQ